MTGSKEEGEIASDEEQLTDRLAEEEEPLMRQPTNLGKKSSLQDVDTETFEPIACCVYLIFAISFTLMIIRFRGPGDINFWVSDNLFRPIRDRGYTQASKPTPNSRHAYASSYNWRNNDMGSTQSTFYDIATVGDLWMHMRQVLLPIIFEDEKDFWVGKQLKLLGGVRLRQVRVKKRRCVLGGRVYTTDYWCYDKFWKRTSEDQTTMTVRSPTLFGPGNHTIKWTDVQENQEQKWTKPGKLGIDYPGSGYVLIIPRNATAAYNIIKELDDDGYIDRATRLLVLDFTLFNPNDELHCVTRLFYEFGSNGFINTARMVKTWKLALDGDLHGDTLWVIFGAFVLFYTLDELKEIWEIDPYDVYDRVYQKDRRFYIAAHNDRNQALKEQGQIEKVNKEYEKYEVLHPHIGQDFFKPCWASWKWSIYYHYFGPSTFDNFYNWIDLVNLLSFWIYIAFAYYLESYKSKMKYPLYDEINFQSYAQLNYLVQQGSYIQTANGVLIWFKVFKYVTFSKRLLMIVGMIMSVTGPLTYFLGCLLLVNLAFATQAYLLFSTDVYAFKSFPTAVMNAFKYLVIELPMDDMVESSPKVGYATVFFWTIFFSMILGNVFVAIVIDAYMEEKAYTEDEEKMQEPKQLVQVFVKGFESGLTSLGNTMTLGAFQGLSRQETIDKMKGSDKDGDGVVTAQELADTFRMNVDDAKRLIKSIDSDGDGKLSGTELLELEKRASAQKAAEKDKADGDKAESAEVGPGQV